MACSISPNLHIIHSGKCHRYSSGMHVCVYVQCMCTCEYLSWILHLHLTAYFYPHDTAVFVGSHSISGAHHSTLRRAFRPVMFQRIALFPSLPIPNSHLYFPPHLPSLIRLYKMKGQVTTLKDFILVNNALHLFTWSKFNFHSISEMVLWRSLWKLYSVWNYSGKFFFLAPIATSKDLPLQASNKRKRGSKMSFVSTLWNLFKKAGITGNVVLGVCVWVA